MRTLQNKYCIKKEIHYVYSEAEQTLIKYSTTSNDKVNLLIIFCYIWKSFPEYFECLINPNSAAGGVLLPRWKRGNPGRKLSQLPILVAGTREDERKSCHLAIQCSCAAAIVVGRVQIPGKCRYQQISPPSTHPHKSGHSLRPQQLRTTDEHFSQNANNNRQPIDRERGGPIGKNTSKIKNRCFYLKSDQVRVEKWLDSIKHFTGTLLRTLFTV